MDSLEQDYAAGLLDTAGPPCVSLYQPTHRHHPDNAPDPIRFRNLVKSLGESLRQKYGKTDVDAILKPFAALAGNADFWNHTLDGLAVLAAPGHFRVYRLQRRVPELVIAADSFHVKPLRRVLQSADRFQILAISRDEIRLFEGNRDIVDEIEPAEGVPRTIVDALGDEVTEPRLTVSSYGHGAQGPAMYHGHGGRKDQIDLDAERYFRAVDRAVLERHSRPSGLPLLLAGLVENQSIFRRVSHNPFLVVEGIDMGPEAVTADTLRERAWRIMEPRYLERLAGFVDQFNESLSKGLATDDLEQAVEAARAGRVATLLVDADCEIAGRIDAETGRIERNELANPEVDDVLDDLGGLVVRNGGEWIIVPTERMPTRTGIAAIYRY
jgi:hypothetical protein